jgi:hypothetical protein
MSDEDKQSSQKRIENDDEDAEFPEQKKDKTRSS